MLTAYFPSLSPTPRWLPLGATLQPPNQLRRSPHPHRSTTSLHSIKQAHLLLIFRNEQDYKVCAWYNTSNSSTEQTEASSHLRLCSAISRHHPTCDTCCCVWKREEFKGSLYREEGRGRVYRAIRRVLLMGLLIGLRAKLLDFAGYTLGWKKLPSGGRKFGVYVWLICWSWSWSWTREDAIP